MASVPARFHPETTIGTSSEWRSAWEEVPTDGAASEAGCAALTADERVTVHLRLRDTGVCTDAHIHEALMGTSDPSSASYGRHWTPERLCSLCGISGGGLDDALRAVRAWASHDLSAADVERLEVRPVPCTNWVSLSGESSAISRMLGDVQLRRFSAARGGAGRGCIVRAPAAAGDLYTLPEVARGHVTLVAGVHTFPRPGPAGAPSPLELGAARLASSEAEPATVTPSAIHSRYGINAAAPPASLNNSQAVISFLGQYFSPQDLETFTSKYGLPGSVSGIASVRGPNDASQPGVEAELDVQYLTGVATGIKTNVYSTPGTNPGNGQEPFLEWLSTVFADLAGGITMGNVFSISYQDFEDTVTPEYAHAVSSDFARLGLMGITLVTGSGDWGVGGKCDILGHCRAFRPDFPSSSPYIVSTGATVINTDGTEGSIGFSSGGFSNIFPTLSNQASAIRSFLSNNAGSLPPQNLFNATGRAFPDIAAVGVNFQVIVNGTVMPVGGTSAATPTFAAVVSLLNDARISSGFPPMGYILPFLYANADAFTDIVSGDPNPDKCCVQGFKPVAGWDPITGLGVPNFPTLLSRAMQAVSSARRTPATPAGF